MAKMKDIAKMADVSISTVSRVFSDKDYYVKESTRIKVIEAAKELGYYPNCPGNVQIKKKTYNIAVLVPDIENDMFPPIIRGAESYLRKKGYNIILCNTNEDLEIERYYVNKLKDHFVDGFIVCSMISESKSVRNLIEEGYPVVLVSRYYGEECDAVIIDNYQASYHATQYLIRSGHNKIALIVGPKGIELYQQRLEGYKAALFDAGKEYNDNLVVYETSGDNGLYQAITEMIKENKDIDAIFATNDHKAIITMKALGDLGLSIPDDISVLGFDNIKVSTLLNPTLSTVSQPFYQMGSLAAKKIYNIINDESKNDYVVDILQTELIIRNSTK